MVYRPSFHQIVVVAVPDSDFISHQTRQLDQISFVKLDTVGPMVK
ncbi:MAG: hypothetical protein ACTMUB_07540 [cyanobacterium endosymbiont of Rhopalodia musculus]|nr:hypothetical protein [cyanobacterium endosymbiont of Epithemia clementina EcSB]WGT67942.1 hypothetical protein P3F56_02345 [cyanobacterium endosymbiont of Epithemia clementina EcSB]